MLACIDDPKLDSTASHKAYFFLVSQPASPCRLSSRAHCSDDYGWSGSTASVRMLRLLLNCSSAVCFGFGYGYGRK